MNLWDRGDEKDQGEGVCVRGGGHSVWNSVCPLRRRGGRKLLLYLDK